MNPHEKQLSVDSLLGQLNIDPKVLHERAAELTRRKILLAAMECFAKEGYHQTTIREIARRAGVTLGAVYHHFEGKKELLMVLNRSRQISSLEIFQEAMKDEKDFFEALRSGFRGQFKLLAQDPILRGLTREYMGMAMTDADVNRMHSQNDIEFRDIAETELKRRYPNLPVDKRASLVRALFISFEGLMTSVVVNSPIATQPDEILDALVNAFRSAIKEAEAKPRSGR
jgi:AcrR family transcriptional regulator